MVRLYILDVFRFLAAISVVFYHFINRPETTAYEWLAPFTQYGYLGVPIFFMISGYVIAVSASNRSAFGFLKARALRLYPVYWVGLMFTVSVILIIGNAQSQAVLSLTNVLANATMLNDLIGIDNIDGVYWTLHAELRFYACIFLLILLGVFKRFYIWLTLWLLVTLIHSVTGQPFFMGWFISPVYSSFFISGITFYLIQRDGLNSFLITLLGVSGISAIIKTYAIAPSFITNVTWYECTVSMLIVLMFYGIFMAAILGIIKIKNYTFLTVVGAMTYPLYLIHNAAGRIIIDNTKQLIGEQNAIAFTILLMVAISFLVVKYIEPKITVLCHHMFNKVEYLFINFKKTTKNKIVLQR